MRTQFTDAVKAFGLSFATTIFLFIAVCSLASADIQDEAFWLIDGNYQPEDLLAPDLAALTRENQLPLTGGVYWHRIKLHTEADDALVIDFQNTSTLSQFTHYFYDAKNQLIETVTGGLTDNTSNPYFLRHGRDLPPHQGELTILTRLDSPFLIAQPNPKVYQRTAYVESIRTGNLLTLIGLGIFVGLGFYYCVLGVVRRLPTDYLYAIFILGILTFFSNALNVFSDVFNVNYFYVTSFAPMTTNISYIAFVMALLNISKRETPVLHKLGVFTVGFLVFAWVLGVLLPQYSMEIARIGVGVFGAFGLAVGIIRARQGHKTARVYLIANAAFFIPGMFTINLQTLPESTMFVEHLGLFAVSLEVMLLALVLSYQLGLVYKEKTLSLRATEEALDIANNAVKSKERFLANVSHELRTPLNAIQGSIELLDENPDPNKKQYIDVIKHSSSFLLFLINDILDLAKLNADMFSIEKRPFNLRKMTRQVCEIYQSSFTTNSDAEFHFTIDDDVPEWIIGDEKRIEQVIANLLSNAFKFSQRGKVSLALTKNLVDGQEQITYSVSDNGIGIDSDKLSSMFAAFTQADSSIARRYGGTGLGLRIASKIVEIMGGKIHAESELNVGSTFEFSIPYSLPSESEVSKSSHVTELPETAFPNLSVVVVDDNQTNLKIISALMRKLEINCKAFLNGKDAIEYLKANYSDMVIMDVQMPELDGLQATRIIRESGYSLPIIAFTANASEQDRLACFESGMNDVLVKPIKLQHLTNVINKWHRRAVA